MDSVFMWFIMHGENSFFVLKYQLDSNLRKPVKFLVLTIAESRYEHRKLYVIWARSTEALTVIDLTIKNHELILSNMDTVMK